jgi:HAMP domain-containing protein
MGEGRKNRKIRNLLIDKAFQLKYTLAVVVISTIISFVLGLFLYQAQQEVARANRENSQLVAMDDPDIGQAMREEMEKDDVSIDNKNKKFLFTLIASLGCLVLTLTILGIVATHKIAGPAYAMRRIMSEIADGRYPFIRALRKGDELRKVAEELKRMADNLRLRDENEADQLEKALHELAHQQIESVKKILQETLDEKNQRLETPPA